MLFTEDFQSKVVKEHQKKKFEIQRVPKKTQTKQIVLIKNLWK